MCFDGDASKLLPCRSSAGFHVSAARHEEFSHLNATLLVSPICSPVASLSVALLQLIKINKRGMSGPDGKVIKEEM